MRQWNKRNSYEEKRTEGGKGRTLGDDMKRGNGIRPRNKKEKEGSRKTAAAFVKVTVEKISIPAGEWDTCPFFARWRGDDQPLRKGRIRHHRGVTSTTRGGVPARGYGAGASDEKRRGAEGICGTKTLSGRVTDSNGIYLPEVSHGKGERGGDYLGADAVRGVFAGRKRTSGTAILGGEVELLKGRQAIERKNAPASKKKVCSLPGTAWAFRSPRQKVWVGTDTGGHPKRGKG